MITIEPKHINITLDNLYKDIKKTSENPLIDLDTNNISIDCETLEVSATPIIFNQLIVDGNDKLIWSVVNTNTGVTINHGYIATNDFNNISFSFGGVATNGQSLAFYNMGQGGFRILKDGIIFGDKVTLVNGYLESLNYGDYILLVYLNNSWTVQQSIGNINIL